MSHPDSNPDLLAEIVEEWQTRLRRGEHPDLSEYTQKYPALADDLRQLLPGLAALENLKGEALDYTVAPTGSAAGVVAGGGPLYELGDYRIIREVGRGGMGVVYEAEQVSLGRRVALKVLPPAVIRDPKQRRRFEREARSAAKLHHTNIVPVFGVGEQDGTPYYVMQFIQGLGLDGVLDEIKRMNSGPAGGAPPADAPTATAARRDVSAADVARSLVTGEFGGGGGESQDSGRDSAGKSRPRPAAGKGSSASAPLSGPLSGSAPSISLPGESGVTARARPKRRTYWQNVAAIGAQVADALEHAHKQGILHRDVKPSNLLLDAHGIVWVTDFGLAKTDDKQDLTHTGDILGTLRYMPPEAFDGKADARGDVYSLGLTLYELLAMRPAFDEKDRHRLIKQVTTGETPHLDRENRAIPRDLVTIVHKAIDRDPLRRYQTAGEMADDLGRFLNDEPILARRSGPWERALRWVRRKPAAAALVAVSTIAALAVAGVVAVLVYSSELHESKQLAERARTDAERARDAEVGQRQLADAARRDAEEEREKANAARKEAERQRELADAARAEAERQRELAVRQRGLLAAHTAQWKEAADDLDGYARAHPTDPDAWLGLGRARAGLGESQQAVEAFDRVVALAPDNVAARVGRAQQEAARGRADAAIADFTHAFKVQPDLADRPEYATVPAALARALYDRSAGWRVLEPTQVSAEGGAILKHLGDGSIVAEGNLSGTHTFTVVARTDLAGIRAIRLETLPDAPVTGRAGRPSGPSYSSGNFLLTEFAVTAAEPSGAPRPVPLTRAWADYAYPMGVYGRYPYGQAQEQGQGKLSWDVGTAIDGDPKTGWLVYAQQGRHHSAVFLTAQPAGGAGGTTLTVRIRFPDKPQYSQNSLGRFRLSVSANPPAPAWECLLNNNTTAGGWVKLAAARFLSGDRAGATAALARSEKAYYSVEATIRPLVALAFPDPADDNQKTAAAFTSATDQMNRYGQYGYEGDLTVRWLVVEAASRCLERDRDNPVYRRARADALAKLENWADAVADYTQLVGANPRDAELLLERGWCHRWSGAAEAAAADFAAAARLNPDAAADWHALRARRFEQSGDWASARLHLDAGAELEKGKPGEADLLLRRGQCLRSLGEKDKALADFLRVLELKPDTAEALLERGGSLAAQGKTPAALADFAAARKLNPQLAQSWHSQQASQYESVANQNLTLCLLHVTEAIAAEGPRPRYPSNLQRRARVYRQFRQYDKAAEDLTLALKLAPRETYILFDRADCFAHLGQTDKAVADVGEVLKTGANGVVMLRSRLRYAEQIGNWPLALIYLDAWLASKPPAADERFALLSRAKARLELRQHAEALADCERLLALAPDDAEGQKLQAQIHVTYARELRLQGKADHAKTAAERARAVLKARSAANPDDENLAMEFVNFLLTEAAGWQPLELTEVTSAGGATLTRQPDGSVLAGGKDPDQETYTLTVKTAAGLHALRLDALPDDSLPVRGPGRHAGGNFLLTDATLAAAPAGAPNDFKPVRWRGAVATYVRPAGANNDAGPRDGPRGVIDGTPITHWDIGPQTGRANSVMLATDGPAGGPGPGLLSVRLEFRDGLWNKTTLGRFRLSGSPSRHALHAEQLLPYSGGGWVQLAAAHAMLGEKEEAEAALRKAEPLYENDGGALLLKAWTAELLGLKEQAGQARRKAIAWLRDKPPTLAVPLPAVAVDVLARAAEDGTDADVALAWLARAHDALGDDAGALAAYDRAVASAKDDPQLYTERAEIHVHAGRWKQAAADLRAAGRLDPKVHWQWYRAAPLLLWAGDEDGYREHRTEMLRQFGDTQDVFIAERTAKACSLLKATPEEAKRAADLANRSLLSTSNPDMQSWCHLALALTSVRLGDHAAALEHVRKSRELERATPYRVRQATTSLAEALALCGSGRTGEARGAIARASEQMLGTANDPTRANPGVGWNDVLMYRLLLREAEVAVNGGTPPPEQAPPPRPRPPDDKTPAPKK